MPDVRFLTLSDQGQGGWRAIRAVRRSFYVSQARTRLAASRRARRLTRFALRRFWNPVGTGVMPEAETRHLLSYLLAGPEGERTVSRIDSQVDRLPGLMRVAGRGATQEVLVDVWRTASRYEAGRGSAMS
jgi:hypothetical protein